MIIFVNCRTAHTFLSKMILFSVDLLKHFSVCANIILNLRDGFILYHLYEYIYE